MAVVLAIARVSANEIRRLVSAAATRVDCDLGIRAQRPRSIHYIVGLVRREGERLFVPSLEPAIAQLHQVWNNFFKRD